MSEQFRELGIATVYGWMCNHCGAMVLNTEKHESHCTAPTPSQEPAE